MYTYFQNKIKQISMFIAMMLCHVSNCLLITNIVANKFKLAIIVPISKMIYAIIFIFLYYPVFTIFQKLVASQSDNILFSEKRR